MFDIWPFEIVLGSAWNRNFLHQNIPARIPTKAILTSWRIIGSVLFIFFFSK